MEVASCSGSGADMNIISYAAEAFDFTIEGAEVFKKCLKGNAKSCESIKVPIKVIRSEMKLYALAATTAVTARRVDTPAPGFVNEQGGYWADQTSDQSRHYQQPPQPSYQQQHGQKPQCANGYYFNAPGKAEPVFMKKIGENDEKPFYSGWFDGEEKFLYWAWNRKSNPTNAVVQAVPGNWFFGSTLGDVVNAISSSTTYGLRHCPTDQSVRWFTADTTEYNFVTLKAGQHDNYNNDHNENKFFDCCTNFKWTVSGHNPVEMTRNDQIHMTRNNKSRDNRHYYTGRFKGAEHFMYFQFDPTPSNFPLASRYGRWYIGEKLDDPDSADFVTNGFDRVHGSKSCPNDPIENFWFYKPENEPIFADDFKFECIEKAHRVEVPVKTCESKKGSHMFYQNETDKCNFGNVVGELVKPMVAQLFQYRQEADNRRSWPFMRNVLDLENLVGDDMVNAINEIKQGKCFTTIDGDEYNPGNYIEGCSGLCNAIKDLDKERYAKDLQQVLYQIVDTYFKAINFSFYQDNNKHREKCVEGFNKLVIAINKFNPFTGYEFGG